MGTGWTGSFCRLSLLDLYVKISFNTGISPENVGTSPLMPLRTPGGSWRLMMLDDFGTSPTDFPDTGMIRFSRLVGTLLVMFALLLSLGHAKAEETFE